MNTRDTIRACLTAASKAVYWERIGYTPHPGQVEFHASSARFKLQALGRRAGKTFSGPRDVGPLVHIPDLPIWIVAPTKELAVKEFRVFQRDLRMLQKGGYLKLDKDVLDLIGGRYLLKVHNGATIEVKTQEKEDQIVGEGVGAVIMAEAARLKPHIWTELVRPTLADHHGVAIFSTTPRGRNWFYELFEAAKDNPDWATFQKPSWTNPIVFPGGIDDPEILELRNSMSGTEFSQEIAAEFVTHAGLIYDEFDHNVHVQRFELLPDVPVNGWVDMGFVDPFVCLITQVHEGRVWIHDEYYATRMTPQEHAERLAPWFERAEGVGVIPELLYCDPRSPDGIKDLKKAGWKAKAAPALDHRRQADNPVVVGIKAVKRLLKVQADGRPALIVHPRCRMTIKEFGLYDWGSNNEPDTRNDDHCCDAIRYGVLAEVARERHRIFDEDEDDGETTADAILGCDEPSGDDDYDPDETWEQQRTRERRREAERAKAGCAS